MTLEELKKELSEGDFDIVNSYEEVEEGVLKLEYTLRGFNVIVYLNYYSEDDGYSETDYELGEDYKIEVFDEEIEEFIKENEQFIYDKLTFDLINYHSEYIINYINEEF